MTEKQFEKMLYEKYVKIGGNWYRRLKNRINIVSKNDGKYQIFSVPIDLEYIKPTTVKWSLEEKGPK
jgi:hypothetical protein